MKVSLSRPQSKKVKTGLNSKKNSHTNSLIYKEINSQMEQIFAKSKYINQVHKDTAVNSSKMSKKNSSYIQSKKTTLSSKQQSKTGDSSKQGVNIIAKLSKELKDKKSLQSSINTNNLHKNPMQSPESSCQNLQSVLKPQLLMNNFFMQKSSIQQPQMMHAGMNSPITNSDENSDNEETMAVLNQKSSNMASSKDLNQLRKSINMLHAEQKRPSQKQTILEEQSPSMLKSISSQIPIKGRGIEKSGRQTAMPLSSKVDQSYNKSPYNEIQSAISNHHGLSKKSYTKTKIKLEAKLFNHYKLQRKLFSYDYIIGKGGFGKVWKVEHVKTRNQYAMKQMLKSIVITKKSVQSVINQRLLLSNLNSPFLVNMHYSFQDRDTLYLVLDLMEGGDLRYHIGNRTFSQIQSKFFVACIILGLQHMHTNNVIHRDIKPENLVLDSRGYIRITDLGIARTLRHNNSSDTSGTPGYMSPEVICRQNHSFCSDYFALGVITHQLMTGKRPYNGRTRNQIRDNMLAKQAQIKQSQIPLGWSAQAGDFINRLLMRKPESRLGFNSIQQIKNHPWVRMINWDKLLTKQIQSPFVPMMKKKNFDQDEQITIEDQQEAQMIEKNSLLLRKPEFQQLFKDYFYDENENILTAKQKTKKRSNPNISASVNYPKPKAQQNESKKKISIQDNNRDAHHRPLNSKIGGKKYSEQVYGTGLGTSSGTNTPCGMKKSSHGTIQSHHHFNYQEHQHEQNTASQYQKHAESYLHNKNKKVTEEYWAIEGKSGLNDIQNRTTQFNMKDVTYGNFCKDNKARDFDCLETLKSGQIKMMNKADHKDYACETTINSRKYPTSSSNSTSTPNQTHGHHNLFKF